MMIEFGAMRKFGLPLIAGISLMTLQACVSFGGAAPVSMLALTADQTVSAGTNKSGTASDALVVRVPDVPRKLETNRVPVNIETGNVAYLKDAVWTDKPAVLMQELLAETIAAKNGTLILSEVETGGRANNYLSGQLVEFGIDASGQKAIVVLDAVKLRKGQPIEKRRFEASEPLGKIEPTQAGEALNVAANKVAGEVAAWMGQ